MVANNSGVIVRQTDFEDYESLVKGFEDIQRLLIVSTMEPNDEKRFEQHKNAIDAAQNDGVDLIVYVSAAGAEGSPLGGAHLATEQYLKASGMTYIILRNNLYLENKLNDFKQAENNSQMKTSAGNGKMGLVLRTQYANVAANILSGDFETNRTYTLSTNSVNYAELAEILAVKFNHPVEVNYISDDIYREGLLQAKINSSLVDTLVANNKTMREGNADIDTPDLQFILGTSPMTIQQSLDEIL